MSAQQHILLVVEDPLSEFIARRLLRFVGGRLIPSAVYGKEGIGYIKRNISGFNKAAKGTPTLIVADLDSDECAPERIRSLLTAPRHPNLLLRIAVREVESWLLADRGGFAKFIGTNATRIPTAVEDIVDPKQFLINVARRSRRKSVLEDIVPLAGSTAKVGRNYNGRLHQFVFEKWNIETARANSRSLDSAIRALKDFVPTF